MVSSKCTAIIPAAGQGKRMNSPENKQFLTLQGMPVIVHTLQVFERCTDVDQVILVSSAGEEKRLRELISSYGLTKVSHIVQGGKERQESVFNGFLHLEKGCDLVVVHDGARPLITGELISEAVNGAKIHGAAVVAVPVKDTIKEVNPDGFINRTLERGLLWQAQTPQVFQYQILAKAFREARDSLFIGTDDSSLVETVGEKVRIIKGSYDNIKITTPEDLILADAIMVRRNGQCG